MVRFGFRPFHSDSADAVVGDFFGRVESVIYTIADAAVSASEAKQSGDWLSGITNCMESVLKVCFEFLINFLGFEFKAWCMWLHRQE